MATNAELGQEPTGISSADMKTAMLNSHRGKRRTYTQVEIDALDPATFGVGSLQRNDGVEFWCDGVSFAVQSGRSAISSTTYNPDGTIATATIDGTAYTFTYASGKIATVVGGGVTKTYTWSGDQLTSVAVS